MGIRFKFSKDEEKPAKVIKIPLKPKKFKIEKKAAPSKAFVLNWEEELGFKKNPFKEDILEPVDKFLVNFEKEREKLNMFILTDNRFGTMVGEDGFGKTILLKWLEHQLKNFRDRLVVNYFKDNANNHEEFVNILLKPFISFIQKKKTLMDFEKQIKDKLKNKRYVLLIDDFNFAKWKIELLTKLFPSISMSVIVTGKKDLIEKINESKKEIEGAKEFFIDKLDITLGGLPLYESKEMIRKRIEKVGGSGIYPFDDEFFSKIWKEADKNQAKLIKLCNKHAMELAVKKTEGIAIDDAVSYKKDDKEIEKPDFDKAIFEDEGGKKSEYKVEIAHRSDNGVVIKEMNEKKKDAKLSKKYTIKRIK